MRNCSDGSEKTFRKTYGHPYTRYALNTTHDEGTTMKPDNATLDTTKTTLKTTITKKNIYTYNTHTMTKTVSPCTQ